MPRFLVALQSFNAGEWGRAVSSRTDLKKYRASMRMCENCIPLVQGTVRRRSGTRYVANTKGDGVARLERFEYSSEQAYILEFGSNYIRFYKDGGQIVSGASPVEVATDYDQDSLFELQFTQNADTLYIFHQRYPVSKLIRNSHTDWDFEEVDFQDGPYQIENSERQTGGPRIAASGITEGASVTVTASGTYLNGDAFAPFENPRDVGRLIRLGTAASGQATECGWLKITAVASATSATATVKGTLPGDGSADWRWWLGAFYGDNYPKTGTFAEQRLWLAGTPDDPQRLWGSCTSLFERFQPTGDLTSDYPVRFGPNDTFDDNAIDYTIGSDDVNAILWMKFSKSLLLGTQSGFFKVGGYEDGALTPSNVRITENASSGAGDVPPVTIDSALIYATRTLRQIRTLGYTLEVDDFQSTDISALAPHIVLPGIVQMSLAYEPNSTVYFVRSDGVLVSLVFMPSQEVSAFSRYIIGGSYQSGDAVVESAATIPSQDLSHDQTWLVVKRTIDGQTVRTVEYMEKDFRLHDAEQDIEEAFMVDCGLSLDGAGSADPVAVVGITNASPAVVTAYTHGYSNGDHVRIRGVSGMTEVNHRAFEVANVTADTFELNTFAGADIDSSDWGVYVSGGEVRKMTTTVSGLDHLEGETVAVVGDGSPQSDQVVSGGAITLATEAAEVHVGFPYTMRVVTNGMDPPTPNGGSLQGVKMRPDKVLVRCSDTVGGKIGGYGFTLDPFDLRTPGNAMTGPRQASEIETMVSVDAELAYQPEIEVRQDQPLPLTLVAMLVHGNASAE